MLLYLDILCPLYIPDQGVEELDLNNVSFSISYQMKKTVSYARKEIILLGVQAIP